MQNWWIFSIPGHPSRPLAQLHPIEGIRWPLGRSIRVALMHWNERNWTVHFLLCTHINNYVCFCVTNKSRSRSVQNSSHITSSSFRMLCCCFWFIDAHINLCMLTHFCVCPSPKHDKWNECDNQLLCGALDCCKVESVLRIRGIHGNLN